MRPHDHLGASLLRQPYKGFHLLKRMYMEISRFLVSWLSLEDCESRRDNHSSIHNQFEERFSLWSSQIDRVPYLVSTFASRIVVGEHGLAILLGVSQWKQCG